MPVRAAVALALLTLVALGAAGCATTRPWQREDLARPVMELDPDPAAFSLKQHLLGTREGAVGGFGGGGGGCGCN